ncbi:MAG: hypothetical protein NTY31_01775 [Candidatus Falkowbacteria bacterium]|nr:hypothetical protein [Candidatus Falkowbacteria bacterium]
MKIVQQIDFSSVLFDTLFGLILFFCLDSFLEIKGILPFIFYLFSIVILVHWWLNFKSADDAFGEEVTNSAIDLVFGIIYVILIEYIILNAKLFAVTTATWFLISLLAIDLIWALIWRYIGRWNTTDKEKIKRMEKELDHCILVNSAATAVFIFLVIMAQFLPLPFYIAGFIVLYIIFIIATFKTKIIDLRIF